MAVLGGLKNDQALKGYEIIHFQPFDPVHKRTEATVKDADGNEFKVAKGAPQVILELSANAAQVKPAVEKAVNDFAARGFRSLGVARAEGDGKWQFLGVLPLFDPPRDDAKATIATARQMGVSVKMVTGDALAIARETAKKLGMGTNILDASGFGDTKRHETAALAESIEKADGFAQVFPEHKFHIVDVLQQGGHIVGMTGDGVNDAPALKKADCGIAVSGATDAARAAAAIVLMTPGLSVIIDAIKESRKIFQRMNSYAIYRIAETLRVLLFMTLSILIFNFYPLTAVMIVMLALLNDGAILSIAYDNVHYKDQPESWNMRLVLGIATVLGVVGVVSAFGLFYLGERVFHLDRAHIQTLMYLKLSVAGHLTIFLTRTRGPFWSIRPARVLWVAVLGTQVLATLIAVYGLFMTPLGWGWSLFVWGYAVAWFLVNDRVKLLAYRILDPVKGGSVRTRAGRAWIEVETSARAGRIARSRTVSIGWDGGSDGCRLGLCPLANTGRRRRPRRSGFRRRRWLVLLVDPSHRRRSLRDAEDRTWLNRPHRDRKRRRRSHGDSANRRPRVRRDSRALLRRQHESEGGPDLCENRPAPLSNRGGSGQRRSGGSRGSARKGQNGSRPRESGLRAGLDGVRSAGPFPGKGSTIRARPMSRRRRRRSLTNQLSQSLKRRFMPARSTSAIPISFRRLMEQWSRATPQ